MSVLSWPGAGQHAGHVITAMGRWPLHVEDRAGVPHIDQVRVVPGAAATARATSTASTTAPLLT